MVFIKFENAEYEIDEDLLHLLDCIAENVKSKAVAGQALYSIILAGVESGSLIAGNNKKVVTQ